MVSSLTSISTVTVSSAPEAVPLAEKVLRRDRALVIVAIIALAGLAWAWILSGAGMGQTAPMAAMASPSIAILLAMWWMMMVAMMVPSAAPMVLLYGRVLRHRGGSAAISASWVFLGGYLMAWLCISVAATLLQVFATQASLIDPMTMRSSSRLLAGATLIAVGAYQFSPVKDACLVNCRSPASFLARHWRPGIAGAARLGLLHGLYCVGC
jgi:predicted metal-binding membrane protein